MFQIILDFVIIWAIILTVGNFFRESHDRRIVYLFSGVILANILSLGNVIAYNYGIVIPNPLLKSLMTSFPFFIGPFYYFYFSAVFGYHDEWSWRRCLHFIPALAAFLFLSVMGLFFGPLHSDRLSLMRKMVFLVQALHILGYYFITARMMNRFRNNSREAVIGMVLTGAYSLTFLITAPGIFFVSGPGIFALLTTVYAYNALVFTVHYLVAQKYTVLFAIYVPRKTALTGKDRVGGRQIDKDSEKIMCDLNFKLEKEKIFLVEDLTLNMLAFELGLSPHRLSYFLNNHAGRNFYSLINSYRVKEAQKILADDPGKSIIAVALDSGFSSKSSFNRVFQNMTGMTPSEYREQTCTGGPNEAGIPGFKSRSTL